MYKTVRIGSGAHAKIDALSEELGCTFLEAVDAIAAASENDLKSLVKENLSKIRTERAKEKAARAVITAQQRVDQLNGK